MEALFNSSILSTACILGCAALVLGVQYLFGYKNWKLLGLVLPVLFMGFVAYCFSRGIMTLSARDIFIPVIALLVLGSAYQRGCNKAKSKQDKELERMKAQDNLR